MKNIQNALAARIQKYRKQSGLTQEELANQLGVTFQAVSKWENAKSAPDILLLPKIAEIFHCQIGELFSFDPDTPIESVQSERTAAVCGSIRKIVSRRRNMKVPGYKGEHYDVSYVKEAPYRLKKLDLKSMAQKALKYLYSNPVPEVDYQCRFSFFPSECPPFIPLLDVEGYIDAIMEGDTESRNDVAFRMMREMLGDYKTGLDIEEHVHQRLIGYLSKENYAKDVCLFHNFEHTHLFDNPGLYIGLWTTGMLLQSECLRYRQGAADLSLARRIFEGLAAQATRENGRAYYRHGNTPYNKEKVNDPFYAGHYPTVFNGLCEYWLVSGDERCMKLMTELAEGFVLDLMPGHLYKGNGELEGHNHVQMHAIRSLAQFAYLSRNPRYLSWVKAIYDYYRKWALDTGWLPERRELSEHCTHSETCLNGDMFETELWLALAGYDELWDQMERDLMNYFNLMQFELTDDFLAWYKNVHADKSEEEIQKSIRILKDLEGGFISAVTPNDYIFKVNEGETHYGMVDYKGKKIVFDMMGCCPPEGMRSIYYAWKYAQVADETGVTVYLPIDSESEYARVETLLPKEGKITVTMKESAPLKVRVPSWADRDSVKFWVNGKETPVQFGGAANSYVCIDSLLANDQVIVEYTLVEFYQKVSVSYCGRATEEYTYHWIGNTVVDVDPKGDYFPLYDYEKSV